MDRTNSRTLLVRAAGFLGAAGLSVLISLPGLSQQSPNNASPTVPSTTKPTNPGGQDAGTTNGGENLNRVPSSDSTTQPTDSMGSQNSTTPQSADPTSKPDAVNRVEGRDQGSPQDRTNSAPSGSSNTNSAQPDANQPGATTGGDASQQVQPANGSMQQRNRTTPKSGGQYQNQQGTPRSDSNSGSTTDTQSTSQQDNTNGSVRALW